MTTFDPRLVAFFDLVIDKIDEHDRYVYFSTIASGTNR